MKVEEVNLDGLDMRYEKLRARQLVTERKLMASLGELGQVSPVIVTKSKEVGVYVVIDGHKRVRALKKLKADVVKVTIWEMGEEEALVASYEMSRQGGRNAVEEGWLVAELHRVGKWSLGRIAEKLMKSKSWVSRRLSFVEEMSGWMAEAVMRGELGAHTAVRFLMPLARANSQEGKVLTEKVCELGLTNRQVSDIYKCYRTSSAEVRKRILGDPVLFLKTRTVARQGKQDPDLSEGENRCANNLELIGNISLGLARSLPEVCASDSSEQARKKLKLLWDQCVERFKTLAKMAASVFREQSERSSKEMEKIKEVVDHVR